MDIRKPKATIKGFSLIELIVVIAIIGILTAVTVVGYTGVVQQATIASIKNDLESASDQLKVYKIQNGHYPVRIDCSATPAPDTTCIKFSSGNTFDYSSSSPYLTFGLVATSKNGTSYRITNSTGPVAYAPIVVSGCSTSTPDDAYTVCTFTSSGTLTVTGGTISGAQVLVVGGGGGGGGGSQVVGGGGGGGGQIILSTQNLAGSTGVSVGSGGQNSVFASSTASPGGGGGTGNPGNGALGGTGGGSGGGSGNGGNGGNYNDTPIGVAGSNGYSSNITGSTVFYGGGGGGGNGYNCGGGCGGGGGGAGGGGGGAGNGGIGGAGGGGIGGTGGASFGGSGGSFGYGGGGGGGGKNYGGGGAGGPGVVIIRYLTP